MVHIVVRKESETLEDASTCQRHWRYFFTWDECSEAVNPSLEHSKCPCDPSRVIVKRRSPAVFVHTECWPACIFMSICMPWAAKDDFYYRDFSSTIDCLLRLLPRNNQITSAFETKLSASWAHSGNANCIQCFVKLGANILGKWARVQAGRGGEGVYFWGADTREAFPQRMDPQASRKVWALRAQGPRHQGRVSPHLQRHDQRLGGRHHQDLGLWDRRLWANDEGPHRLCSSKAILLHNPPFLFYSTFLSFAHACPTPTYSYVPRSSGRLEWPPSYVDYALS